MADEEDEAEGSDGTAQDEEGHTHPDDDGYVDPLRCFIGFHLTKGCSSLVRQVTVGEGKVTSNILVHTHFLLVLPQVHVSSPETKGIFCLFRQGC